MDKSMSKIIIAIISIVIIMISVIAILLVYNKQNQEKDPSGIIGEDDSTEFEYQVNKIDNVIEFETVRTSMQQYINLLEMNKMTEASEISEDIIFETNKEISTEVFMTEIYGLTLNEGIRYYIQAETSISNEIYYLIFDMDTLTKAYKLQKISEEIYKEEIKKQHDESNTQSISVEKKNNNGYKDAGIDSTYSLLDGYVNLYKSYINKNMQIAYEMLDDEYKNKKFNNSYEEFEKFINKNKNKLLNENLTGYLINEKENYTEYEVDLDGGDAFIIRSNELGKFTILLDNYTIKTQEFIENYNKLEDKQKVSTNIDKIFKLLNNHEYEEIYNYISDDYKKNNLPTFVEFEKYVKEKFFDYNYKGAISIKSEQQYYIAQISYSDGISSAAEYRKISIIMRLDDNAEFKIAFVIE